MNLDGTTRAILKQIESLGYAVIIRNDGTMAAVKSDGSGDKVAASNDDPYKCACRLAELVGIDLEDG